MLLLMLFAALASKFGFEAILGAFLAGAALELIDRDEAMTHTRFYGTLQAVGFGAFVPFFFVSTGMKLDVESLVTSGSTLARVPVFLLALLIVRAPPAILYRPPTKTRGLLAAAGLLQATSLSIPVVAGQIGIDLGLIPAPELRRARRGRSRLRRDVPAADRCRPPLHDARDRLAESCPTT